MAINSNQTTSTATANTVKAMRRSATTRQCPECLRKSALVSVSDDVMFGRGCRWCGWEQITMRE